ncbi:hypothetical protein PTKU46_80230 [Paraburkholderia terrae]|uniref:hypothetical protein n=1 Tax=Paraburkholderia terrae TaxID=311230 RepID=UPI0030E2BFB9
MMDLLVQSVAAAVLAMVILFAIAQDRRINLRERTLRRVFRRVGTGQRFYTFIFKNVERFGVLKMIGVKRRELSWR